MVPAAAGKMTPPVKDAFDGKKRESQLVEKMDLETTLKVKDATTENQSC